MGIIWANTISQNGRLSGEEYEKVQKVHSFSPFPGSKKKPAWEEIRKRDGAKWYILKYASKFKQKEVPPKFCDVGRFWGNSTDIPPKEFQEVEVTEEEIRTYLASKALSVTKRDILPKLIIVPN